ncbi:serine hydrolase domain-containing protein [Paenibacillus rubinfantis]|uniref:serine hydrolase domain-containing protein n=1 Tax=Paenibacillus rubinfantis TaxID=1720296 RepID=UPI00073F5DE7|nr:serine hydrolase [Paenibacillus rubinfantis]
MTVTKSLPRSKPEKQGVSSSGILSFLEEIEQRKLELHGFMFLRNGHVLAEGWWKPYHPEIPHAVYSLTKSFTSLAVGFAVQEGKLTLDQRVLAFFPEMDHGAVSVNIGAMSIRHLLTMTTGHEVDTARFGATGDFLQHMTAARVGDRSDRDYVRGFMEHPVTKTPGTYFLYNSGASHVLGAIIERVTGSQLVDYLQPRLFVPLGIDRPAWEEAPQGENTGGWGLKLCTEDIAKFGQFLLNKGVWNGHRLISAEWIEQAVSRQVDNKPVEPQEGQPINIDWIQGYGYQFWRCRHNAYRGDGAFGQYCIVLPDQDAVIAMNGGLRDMQGVIDAVWRHLLPSMNEPLPSMETVEFDQLASKLASLELGELGGLENLPWDIPHKRYSIHSNEQGVQRIGLTFTEKRCVFQWWDAQGEHQWYAGIGDWNINNRGGDQVAVRGVWLDRSRFEMYVYPPDSPHYDRLTFQFQGNEVSLQHEHLSFIPLKHEFIGVEEK